MERIELKILEILLTNRESFMNSKQLSSILSISDKTVLNKIESLNKILPEYEAQVIKQRGSGVKLVIYDENNFFDFYKKTSESFKIDVNSPEQRRNYIIFCLLTASESISIDYLMSRLFVSDQTIYKDIKIIRDELKKYNISLQNKRNEGYLLVGAEKNIREYFQLKLNLLNTEKQNTAFSKDLQKIAAIINEVLLNNNIYINNDSLKTITIALYINIHRKNNSFKEINLLEEIKDERVIRISKSIVEKINEEFYIGLEPQAIKFIIVFLLSNNSISNNKKVIPENIEILVKKILDLIEVTFQINLRNDLEFVENLSIHLIPLIYRIKLNLNNPNELLYEIKTNYPFGFLLGKLAASVISEQYDFDLPDEEIAYLALHFNLAIEKHYVSQFQKKNVLIVCGSGLGSARILEHQIKNEFSSFIDKIYVSNYEFDSILTECEIDFIVSTIPKISTNFDKEIIYVNYILSDYDKQFLYKRFNIRNEVKVSSDLLNESDFMQLKAKNKIDVIHLMFNHVKSNHSIEENVLNSILEREKLFSTNMGNLIAMPHPMEKIKGKTIIACAILDNPIQWDESKVQLVFMILIGEDTPAELQRIYKLMSEIIIQEENVIKILSDKTFKSIQETINRVRRSE